MFRFFWPRQLGPEGEKPSCVIKRDILPRLYITRWGLFINRDVVQRRVVGVPKENEVKHHAGLLLGSSPSGLWDTCHSANFINRLGPHVPLLAGRNSLRQRWILSSSWGGKKVQKMVPKLVYTKLFLRPGDLNECGVPEMNFLSRTCLRCSTVPQMDPCLYCRQGSLFWPLTWTYNLL